MRIFKSGISGSEVDIASKMATSGRLAGDGWV
jgi:hypothetical protein